MNFLILIVLWYVSAVQAVINPAHLQHKYCTSTKNTSSLHIFDNHHYHQTDCSASVINIRNPDGKAFWNTGLMGCLLVFVTQNSASIDVALISSAAILRTTHEFCMESTMFGTSGDVCAFSFLIAEAGVYNISIRGDACPVDGNFAFPLASLGYAFGRDKQVRTRSQFQILSCLTKECALGGVPPDFGYTPRCSFQHEYQMRNSPFLANPRWRKRPWVSKIATDLQRVWYNDTYFWGNELCHDHTYAPDEWSLIMASQNVTSVLLIGDSLTRFMFDDFEDFFSGVTQDWLNKHPLHYTDSDMGDWSNWDGIVSGWIGGDREQFSCKFPDIAGLCYRNGILVEGCVQNGPVVRLSQWLPGYGATVKQPMNASEYYAGFLNYIDASSPPSVIVFNAGLWIIEYPDPVTEIKNIVTGMASVCSKYNISLVWRSTLYHHEYGVMNSVLRNMNAAAIRVLDDLGSGFSVDSTHGMSSLRPDRTSDGFHYSYRKTRSKWHYCLNETLVPLSPNCIRHPGWPMSVTKAMSLHLINMLAHSNLN